MHVPPSKAAAPMREKDFLSQDRVFFSHGPPFTRTFNLALLVKAAEVPIPFVPILEISKEHPREKQMY